MVCRAPNSTTTCSGTQTGQQMSYDNERRLTHWQNTPSSPTTTVDYRYDGEGNRVAMQVKSGGVTTTTHYPSSFEEKTGSTLTKYYSLKGLPLAVNVGGTISYLASDSLHSVSEAFNSSGTVTAQQLYLPFGSARYSNGTLPTRYGFTEQRGDLSTGLDYYNARYYDPVLGQFTSADSVLDGLNRYAYVGDNPETLTDPTGHDGWFDDVSKIAVGVATWVGLANPVPRASSQQQASCETNIVGCVIEIAGESYAGGDTSGAGSGVNGWGTDDSDDGPVITIVVGGTQGSPGGAASGGSGGAASGGSGGAASGGSGGATGASSNQYLAPSGPVAATIVHTSWQVPHTSWQSLYLQFARHPLSPLRCILVSLRQLYLPSDWLLLLRQLWGL